MFSDIVQRFDTPLNALTKERDARRAKGQKVTDLVSGNVNLAGIHFPPSILKNALIYGARQAWTYAPHPQGQPVARQAVSAYYHRQELTIPTSQIVITPGTSVSYWYLFKLLANPGDEILSPRPSYPLLDSIAELCGIRLVNYNLLERSRWEIDLTHLVSQITPKTRAIILISPHNPTGAVATEAEIKGLVEIALKHHLPIISDEVFSPFLFTQYPLPRPASHKSPLVFTLNGASKMFALPGLKIGWIAVSGERSHVDKAIRALDMISDTFLPVNEAAQFALPVLFKKGRSFLARFQKEVRARSRFMLDCLARIPGISFVRPEGGFYVTLRLESGADEESITLDLLRKEGLLVHPGYFYDLEGSHLIFSFMSPAKILSHSLKKISSHLK